jgi:hypothetical protein
MRLSFSAAIAGLAATVFATGLSTAADAGSLRISIDLSSQRMHVKSHGETVYSWPISSGRAGYHTIRGTFKPKYMTRMHYSKKYDNAPMPNSIFFHGGYAIHGTYATGRLGRPASHGCVRLSPGNAKTLYNLVKRHGRGNTTISVRGSTPSSRYYAKKSQKKRYVKRSTRRTTSYSRKRPKVIYRNGRPYVYVGRKAARRYYAGGRYANY